MRTLPWLLLAIGCGDPNPLGGQEGEPVVPNAPPPAADFEDVDAAAPCAVAAHCMGDGWCVEYGDDVLPDLEEVCPDTSGEGPCPGGAIGTCPLADGDACSTIHVMDPDSASLCE